MDILVFSPTPSFPADQGNRSRVNNLCKAFKDRGATIHFAYFPREWGGRFSRKEYTAMSAQWDFFDTIIPSAPFVYKTEEKYFKIDDWWDPAIERFIRYKINGHKFEACIVNYAFFSKVFDFIPPETVKILDTHDRLSGRHELLAQNGIAPEFFYTSQAEENLALERANVILAINDEEARYFRTQTANPVLTLGHIIASNKVKRPLIRRSKVFRMGFLGSSNSVNVKNINDFLAELARKATDGLPGLEIHIYGSCCSRVEVPGDLKVTVKLLGRVEHIDEFYANVDCVFVPFLFGTGQKIKVIEALSYGVPLIATANACSGSGSRSASHLIESFDGVIEAMRRFQADAAYRKNLANESVKEFKNYNSFVQNSLDTIYNIARIRSISVSIDACALARRLKECGRSEVIDICINMISMLDMLSMRENLTGKEQALSAILYASTEVLGGERRDAPRDEGQINTYAHVSFVGVEAPHSSKRMEIQIHIPGLSSQEALRADREEVVLDLFVNMAPPRKTPSKKKPGQEMAIFTPTHPQRHDGAKRYSNITVLAPDITAPDLVDVIRKIRAEVKLRVGRHIPVICIDELGRRGEWGIDNFRVDDAGHDALDILSNARALVLTKPSITFLYGSSYLTAKALHRVLINDGGPLISMPSGPTSPVEDEVFVSSTREAGVWISLFCSATHEANMFASRRRSSVSPMESLDIIADISWWQLHEMNQKRLAAKIASAIAQEALFGPADTDPLFPAQAVKGESAA